MSIERCRIEAVEPDADAVGGRRELVAAAAVDLDRVGAVAAFVEVDVVAGVQTIRSLPAWPKAWSSASPPVRMSFSLPPVRMSNPPRPRSVSLPL